MKLGVEGEEGKISFYYQSETGSKQYITKGADARMLSTEVAGGFVGAHIGLHVRDQTGSINQLDAYCRKH